MHLLLFDHLSPHGQLYMKLIIFLTKLKIDAKPQHYQRMMQFGTFLIE